MSSYRHNDEVLIQYCDAIAQGATVLESLKSQTSLSSLGRGSDTSGVIALSHTHTITVLNLTASLIFEAALEGKEAETIAITLQKLFAVSPARATEDVKQTIAAFLEKGLLLEDA
jgi:hypothetical protein